MARGVLLIDHGSRRREAHQSLIEAGKRLEQHLLALGVDIIVESSHMEIAEPTIAQGFARCVERGASEVIVVPCFLSRGRHVVEDIPAQINAVHLQFAEVKVSISVPLLELSGFVPMLAELVCQSEGAGAVALNSK